MNNRGIVASVALVFGLTAFAGCAPAPTPEPLTCDAAVAAVAPIPAAEGIEGLLMSMELAKSTGDCASPVEWMAALRGHPEVVAVDMIDEDDAISYLGGACLLLAGDGQKTPVCDDATVTYGLR